MKSTMIISCYRKFFFSLALNALSTFSSENVYRIEGAKDALICGYSSDAGYV